MNSNDQNTQNQERIDAIDALFAEVDQRPQLDIQSSRTEMGMVMGNKELTCVPEIDALGKKWERVARKYGSIVADIHPSNAERLVVALKQRHTTEQLSNHLVEHPETIDHFLRHQGTLFLTQKEFFESAPTGTVHIMPEGMADPDEWIRMSTEFRQYSAEQKLMYKNMYVAMANGRFTAHIHETLKKDKSKAKEVLNDYGGGKAFLYWLAMLGNAAALNHCHRFEPPETLRQAWLQHYNDGLYRNARTMNDVEFDAWCDEQSAQLFALTHPYLIQSIQNNIPAGHAAILILGSDHFHSGARGHTTDSPRNHSVESYVENSPQMDKTRFIVMQPNYLR